MNGFKKFTLFEPMPTATTSTTWGGWPTMNPKCLRCLYASMRCSAVTCWCVSRTIRHGEHGDECLSYVDRDSRLAEWLRGDA